MDLTRAASDGFEPGDIIRAKWTMDGAATLEEAAERLEGFAASLRQAHNRGWGLAEPISDDYGILTSPDGDSGADQEHESPV